MRLATERLFWMALFSGRLNAGRAFAGRLFGRVEEVVTPDLYVPRNPLQYINLHTPTHPVLNAPAKRSRAAREAEHLFILK